MMKKMCKKFIVCLMLILTLFNFMCSIGGNLGEIYAAEATNESEQVLSETEKEASGSINGIGALLERAIRAIAVMIGELIQSLGFFVVNSGGTSDSTAATSSVYYSPFDLFFDKFTLTSVNIFKTDDLPTDASGNVDETGIVYSFRSAILGLFTLATTISVVLLFAFLAITLAKRLLSSPEKKAEASNSLTDCVFKFALVVFADLIILLVIAANQSLVNILYRFGEGLDVSSFMKSLRSAALGDNYILGIGSCIAFVVVCWQTFKYTIAYILRFFMVALLIVIAPFMGLFYSHSKSSQGIPGGFNKWFKMLVSNVFIQSIDCLLYLMCVAVPLSGVINETTAIDSVSSLCGAVMLVAGVMFVKQGEKVLMKLVGLDDSVISLNSVSSGISNAVHTVTNTALTGVAIAQGNYSVMNVTNSPVSFGNDVQGAAGNGSNGEAGIHQSTKNAQETLKGMNGESSNSDATSNGKNNNSSANQSRSRGALSSNVGVGAGAAVGATAGIAAGVAADVASDVTEEEKDKIDTSQVQKIIDDLNKNVVADGYINLLKETETEKTSEVVETEKEGTHTEQTTENNTFEKEEETTEIVREVPTQEDIDSDRRLVSVNNEKLNNLASNLENQVKQYYSSQGLSGKYYQFDSAATREELEKIYKKEGMDGLEAYVNIRANAQSGSVAGAEGEFAKAFMDYIKSKEKLDADQNAQLDAIGPELEEQVKKYYSSQGLSGKYYQFDSTAAREELEKIYNKQGMEGLESYVNVRANAQNGSVAGAEREYAKSYINYVKQPEKTEKTEKEIKVETEIDKDILNRLSEQSATFQTMLKNDAAPLKVINSTSPQVMNGKIDVSYEAVNEIAGNIENHYNYEAAINEIKRDIEAEGADKAAQFERFCDAENNEKVEEAIEAAKALTTDKQKEGARLVIENKMAGTIVATTSYVAERMNTNTSNQTTSQTVGTSEQTQNVINQIKNNNNNNNK